MSHKSEEQPVMHTKAPSRWSSASHPFLPMQQLKRLRLFGSEVPRREREREGDFILNNCYLQAVQRRT